MHLFIMVRETLSIEAFKFHLGSDTHTTHMIFLYSDVELSKIHENGTWKGSGLKYGYILQANK